MTGFTQFPSDEQIQLRKQAIYLDVMRWHTQVKIQEFYAKESVQARHEAQQQNKKSLLDRIRGR